MGIQHSGFYINIHIYENINPESQMLFHFLKRQPCKHFMGKVPQISLSMINMREKGNTCDLLVFNKQQVQQSAQMKENFTSFKQPSSTVPLFGHEYPCLPYPPNPSLCKIFTASFAEFQIQISAVFKQQIHSVKPQILQMNQGALYIKVCNKNVIFFIWMKNTYNAESV